MDIKDYLSEIIRLTEEIGELDIDDEQLEMIKKVSNAYSECVRKIEENKARKDQGIKCEATIN